MRRYFRPLPPAGTCETCGGPKQWTEPKSRKPYTQCPACVRGQDITITQHSFADADPMARLVDYKHQGGK